MKALKNVYQMMITSMKEAKGTFSVTFPEQSRSSAARPVSPFLLNKTNISTMFLFRCRSEKWVGAWAPSLFLGQTGHTYLLNSLLPLDSIS